MDRLRWLLLVSVAGLLIAHPKVAFADSVSESDTLIVFGRVATIGELPREGLGKALPVPKGIILPKVAVELTEANGSISDIVFRITLGGGQFGIALLSDPLSFDTNGFTVKKIPEKPGEIQDVSKEFGLPIFKVKVLSDEDVVPEPGTLGLLELGLLGNGMIGLAGMMRRKLKLGT